MHPLLFALNLALAAALIPLWAACAPIGMRLLESSGVRTPETNIGHRCIGPWILLAGVVSSMMDIERRNGEGSVEPVDRPRPATEEATEETPSEDHPTECGAEESSTGFDLDEAFATSLSVLSKTLANTTNIPEEVRESYKKEFSLQIGTTLPLGADVEAIDKASATLLEAFEAGYATANQHASACLESLLGARQASLKIMEALDAIKKQQDSLESNPK